MTALAPCDLIIEAAYETMDVKQSIFGALDAIAKPGAVLATNTSYLDVDSIAAVTTRPQDVVGLHFFSPANIMKLLEIVRAGQTAPDVLATALALAKRIGKQPVVAGNAWGFIGNRMLTVRRREAETMVVEGASPQQVDRVLQDFGFAMGPFGMADLAGLDLGWSVEASTGSTIRERLCEAGRRGQKSRAGFYDYDEAMNANISDEADAIISEFARDQGILRRSFSDAEVLDRLLWPMIDEGAKLLAEGVAQRASDIDVVWLHGYGWPRWTGGPMFHARQTGIDEVCRRLETIGVVPSDALRKL
jgi:3-hydroxyacyl-CoA dehydrogenase